MDAPLGFCYIVKVETPIGKLPAEGLHPTRFVDKRGANALCRSYRKRFPASSYSVEKVKR